MTVITEEQILDLVIDLLDHEPVRRDDRYEFTVGPAQEPIVVPLWRERLEGALATLNLKQTDSTALYDDQSYEILVRQEARYFPARRPTEIADSQHGLSFGLDQPSDAYTLFLLEALSSAGVLKSFPLFGPLFWQMWQRRQARFEQMQLDGVAEGDIPDETELDVLELISSSLRAKTVRVKSQKPVSLAELTGLSRSFLFQLAYNLDAAFVEARDFEDILRAGRIARVRRIRPQQIDPPRRSYVPELTYHYQMGVAAESPVLSFLSYYHVAEYFFQTVFDEDLIESVRSHLTDPGFSYSRKRDIRKLLKEVSKRLRVRAESVTFSEQEALRLLLSKYLSPGQLVRSLADYDASVLDYFRTQSVPFCDGGQVDLASDDEAEVISGLARRIYRTRNAIVHSKEGEMGRYIPFEHDKYLVREVPLMRFVAEQIIIRSSRLLR